MCSEGEWTHSLMSGLTAESRIDIIIAIVLDLPNNIWLRTAADLH